MSRPLEPGAAAVWPVWASGALAAVLFVGVSVHLWPLRPGVVALQFAWQPQAFGGIIHFWSEADLARYRSHLPVDMATLLAYGAFGWLLAGRTRFFEALAPAGRTFARYCLPLAALFDAAENGFHWWLTAMPRFDAPLTYLASTTCSTLKWCLLIGFGVTVLRALARAGD